MPEEEFFLAFAGSLINRGARGTNRTLPHPMGFLADIGFFFAQQGRRFCCHIRPWNEYGWSIVSEGELRNIYVNGARCEARQASGWLTCEGLRWLSAHLEAGKYAPL